MTKRPAGKTEYDPDYSRNLTGQKDAAPKHFRSRKAVGKHDAAASAQKADVAVEKSRDIHDKRPEPEEKKILAAGSDAANQPQAAMRDAETADDRKAPALPHKTALKRILLAAACVCAVAAATVLLPTMTGGTKPEVAAEAGAVTDALPQESEEPQKTPAATLAPLTALAEDKEEIVPYAPQAVVFKTLEPGVDDPEVEKLQSRLMELEYIEDDETTQHYGSETKEAVALFQRKHDLAQTGVADSNTLGMLYSSFAKVYTVSKGDEGTDVKELQQRLTQLGYMQKVSGSFGTETQAAVKAFQEKNSLTADGSVGTKTRELLYSEDAKANTLSSGTTGDEVKSIQKRLVELNYLSKASGTYDSDTKAAVKAFQEMNGLIGDGNVGPDTKALLFSDKAQAKALRLGDSGGDVKEAQQRLVKLKYMGKATGYFGTETQSAVKAFQTRNSLTADGKIGAKTKSVLFSDGAKAAAEAAAPKPSPTPAPSAETPKESDKKDDKEPEKTPQKTDEGDATSQMEKFIAFAESKLGCKYVLGAKGPDTFDCSGLAYWCLNKAGVNQSYMTSVTWRSCTKYKKISKMSSIKRGDIIIYTGNSPSKGHVGIAIGGGAMIDASSTNGKVVKRSYGASYWQEHFYCAFRVFSE